MTKPQQIPVHSLAGFEPMIAHRDAAAFLGCDERTIRDALKDGRLQGTRLLGRVFVYLDSIRRLLAAGATGQTTAAPSKPAAPAAADAIKSLSQDEFQRRFGSDKQRRAHPADDDAGAV